MAGKKKEKKKADVCAGYNVQWDTTMARLHWPAVLSSLEARVGRQITRHTVPRLHKRLEAIVRRDPGELTWKDGVSLPWGHMETLHLPTVHVQLDMATMVLEVSVHVHRFCCESRVR